MHAQENRSRISKIFILNLLFCLIGENTPRGMRKVMMGDFNETSPNGPIRHAFRSLAVVEMTTRGSGVDYIYGSNGDQYKPVRGLDNRVRGDHDLICLQTRMRRPGYHMDHVVPQNRNQEQNHRLPTNIAFRIHEAWKLERCQEAQGILMGSQYYTNLMMSKKAKPPRRKK